jgi:putative intracellular protease/amidase
VAALAAIRTPGDHTALRVPPLLELVAALRRTDAVGVALTCARPDVLAELLGDVIEVHRRPRRPPVLAGAKNVQGLCKARWRRF